MSKLIDTSLDPVGDIVFTRNDVELGRVDAAGAITTKGTVNGGYTPALDTGQKWPAEAAGATLISGFASGHGFTALGVPTGGSISLNDTTIPGPFSAQSITVVNGTSGTGGAQKGGFALDFTGKSVLLWFKLVNATSNTPGIELTLSDSGFTNFFLGQINGPPGATSGVLHDPESGWYCAEFFLSAMTQTGSPTIANITNIRFYVNSSGAQGGGASNIQVSFGGIATRPLTPLYPNGVVSFTFDDSSASDYTLARPTLAAYNVPATSFVIADQITQVAGAGTTAAQYRQMQDELGWEVAGHAFTTAAHNTRYENLSAADLAVELKGLKAFLLDNGFTSESWASPGGSATTAVWVAAAEYFNSHRNAGYVTNWLTASQQAAPAVRPYCLIAPTWDASQGATVASFKAAIDKAKADKAWLIFNFHRVVATASSGEDIQNTDLDQIVAYAVAQGVAVRTVGGVLKETAAPSAPVSSVFSRTGAVVAGNADYLAVASGGLTGAVTATRYVGGTTGAAPSTGTFAVGDFVIGATGIVWICVTAGSPGTWQQAAFDSQSFATGIAAPPTGMISNTTGALTASRGYVVRFVAGKPLVVTKIAFVTSVAAGSNDNCDVGIFDAAMTTLLGSSGSTAGKLNATAGVQSVTLLASVTLVPGKVYYAAFAAGTFGGSAASLVMTSAQGNSANLMGSAAPNVGQGFQNTAFPLAAPFSSGPISNVPVLALLA